jgi:hypothetical protein
MPTWVQKCRLGSRNADLGREMPSVGPEMPTVGLEMPTVGRATLPVGREMPTMGQKTRPGMINLFFDFSPYVFDHIIGQKCLSMLHTAYSHHTRGSYASKIFRRKFAGNSTAGPPDWSPRTTPIPMTYPAQPMPCKGGKTTAAPRPQQGCPP